MISDPDYARIFTQARVVAWQHGYACCLHGSGTRDLDLVLVPWTEQARLDTKHLIERLARVTGTRVLPGCPRAKPHGREAWSLMLPGFDEVRWVDVSVIPQTVANTNPRPLTEAETATVLETVDEHKKAINERWPKAGAEAGGR